MTAPGPPRREGPLLFADDLMAPSLSEGDAHHVARVLRVRVGDSLVLSDGEGRWCPGRLVSDAGGVEVTGPVSEVPQSSSPLTVAFAPVKGDRPEWAVQKLTEIGADHIVLLAAERSVVRWRPDRTQKHLDRLRRIAREASMQCRRCRIPRVDGLRPAIEVLREPGAVAAEPGGPPLDGAERLLAIGPEGGWSSVELAQAEQTVGLSPNVLRAETATVVGAALMVAVRDGLTRPATNSG